MFLASATPKNEATLRYALCGVSSQDFSGDGVKLLLAAGAPTSGCDGPYPPLGWAASVGNAAAVRLLLDAGANASEPSADKGECPLAVALLNVADAGEPPAERVRQEHVFSRVTAPF